METGSNNTTHGPSAALYRRNPRSSPIGLGALVLGVVGASTYIAGVAIPIADGTIIAVLDSPTHNAGILIAIISSGVAILLSLFSLALEQAPVPALLSLLLLMVVENTLFIMMPIWTLMLGRWGLGLLYGFAALAAFILLLMRVARKIKA